MNSDNHRFIDNGDGTVTLLALGLMFSQATITEVDVTQHQAEDLCRELRLAGHDDWRLPSDHELLALVDRSRHNPAIDTTSFPDTKLNWYWTSTVCAWSSARAWCVVFVFGGCCGAARGDNYGLVRAVRSVPAGYALVPVEPTEAMLDAGHAAAWRRIPSCFDMTDVENVYRAMLAAAREVE